MGEVYRAHDTRLRRDVAVKLLPEHFLLDAERRTRFERETQVLVSLNHPNIAALFEIVAVPGGHALVLELVEGETLTERIARGALPVREALGIAAQIATALEAAHEQGIVHRDLKPGNVKLRLAVTPITTRDQIIVGSDPQKVLNFATDELGN